MPDAVFPTSLSKLPSVDKLEPYLRQIDENRRHSNFGPLHQQFVAAVESRIGQGKVALTANGSLGLMLALKAVCGETGGLCAMPSWTYAATPAAACAAGLTPLFLDVDEHSWALDPDQVKERLADAPGAVSAILVVAPFGQSADVGAWDAFHEATGIPVVIDAANGFDSLSVGRSPTMVSLHATKAFGIGEGGFVASLDTDLIKRIRNLTNHGFTDSNTAELRGINAKVSEYGAAVGLAALDEWSATRAAYVSLRREYVLALDGRQPVTLAPDGNGDHATSTFNIRMSVQAEPIIHALNQRGIQARKWWANGCHRQPAYARCPRLGLPVTEALAEHVFGLPFFLGMEQPEIQYIADTLGALLEEQELVR
jgi:dTDP-4-amino-4,6-dideoxygalactose transaminase